MATTPKTTEPTFTSLGENVTAAVVDGQLVLKIDLDHRNDLGIDPKTELPRKTIRVASTLGNKNVNGTKVFLGINAYVYRTPK